MTSPAFLENQTILIRGGRIIALGPVDSVTYDPDEVTEIDGRGRFVMPGLVDVHVHLRESTDEALIRYLRAGVTTVRDMNGRPSVGSTMPVTTGSRCTPSCLRLRSRGSWKRLDVSVSPSRDMSPSRSEPRSSPAVSVRSSTSRSTRTKAWRTRSVTGQKRTCGQSSMPERSTCSKLDDVVRRTVEAGVWNVPTIVGFDRNLPTTQALAPWRDRELRAEGARNRRLMVRRLREAGFTPMEALEAATVGGARLLGGLDDSGVVAPGRRADLLVLYCDPREDLSCLADIEWVMARGRLPVHEVDRQRARARTGPQR